MTAAELATDWIIAPAILPAITAAILILMGRRDIEIQRFFSVVSTLVLLGVALFLYDAASDGVTKAYRLGAWPAPFGIVLVIDRLSTIMLVLTAALTLAVLLYAIAGWDRRGRHFHALIHFQLLGLNGAFLTGDLFNLFVFFEVMLIASYGLMLHGGGAQRLRAGFQYVAINLIASSLFLVAVMLTALAAEDHARGRGSRSRARRARRPRCAPGRTRGGGPGARPRQRPATPYSRPQ